MPQGVEQQQQEEQQQQQLAEGPVAGGDALNPVAGATAELSKAEMAGKCSAVVAPTVDHR